MSAPRKLNYLILAISIALATTASGADRPDAGTLLRESTPPPLARPQPETPKLVPQQRLQDGTADGVKVKAAGFTFDGNTLFTGEQLSTLLAGYVGQELTLAQLNGVAEEISAAYRAKGYFLASASIPPQTIKGGAAIHIHVTEGVLEGVYLEIKAAETRTPRSLLTSYIERVPGDKPAEEGVLSDLVMRTNELPGISSRISLESGSKAGTARAQLEVTEGRPYSFTIDTDNHGNHSTGYYRTGATLELYSPLHLGDSFTLRGQSSYKASPSGETKTIQTGYSLPVSAHGTRAAFNYSFVDYELGKPFKDLDATGEAHNFTMTVAEPLIRSRGLILTATAGGEAKLLVDRTGSVGLVNKRHTVSGQAGMNGVEMDALLGGGSTSFSLVYTNGVVAIDDPTTFTNDQSSTGLHTDGGYNKLAVSLSRNQNVYKALSFSTGATGQWADTNLDSAEQFSLGGPNGVRAFPASDAGCDTGVVSTTELRYLVGTVGGLPGALQVTGFFDYGFARLHMDPLASDNTRSLAGFGFGLSWFDADSFSIRTSLAWRTVGSTTGQSERTEPTMYVLATMRF